MKKPYFYALLVLLLVAAGYFTLRHTSNATWSGVDETVVEKFARAAGRPPHRPLIDTDQGDLLLFVFLIAGVVGGFVMGYYVREVFPDEPQPSPSAQGKAELETGRQ